MASPVTRQKSDAPAFELADDVGIGRPAKRRGHAHLADPTLSNGSFYVVLTDAAGDEAFASAPVSVN